MLVPTPHVTLLAGYGSDTGAGGLGVPYRELLLVLCVAAIVTFLTTGVARAFAVRADAVAYPRDRDVHAIPTPRWGGVGIYTGIVAAFLAASHFPALLRGFEFSSDLKATLIGATVIVAVGVADDRWMLDAVTKLVGQVAAAGVMVLLGLYWMQLYVPLGSINTLILDSAQGGILTILITVAVVNAMNFVDGLDGLAAGLGLIAALAIFVLSLNVLHDQGGAVSGYPPALITAALAGACLGFLPHNFQPARIFMGDSGAMLIGLMLAAASTSASGRISLSAYGVGDMLVLLSPLLVVFAAVFVPLLDLVLAVVRRLRAGRHPFSADRMHLHHRLLDLGHTVRRTVLIIYLWVATLTMAAVLVTLVPLHIWLPVTCATFASVLLLTLIPRLRRRRDAE